MKKIMSMLLTVCLVFSLLPMGTLTAIAASDGDYTYTVSVGEATITDVNDSISGAVTIPSTLGGYPVTTIGNWAFSSCTKVTSITIPDSVTSIGEGAFWQCTSLTSITIPNSVTSIGDSAFFSCTKLTSITIPSYVTSIGNYAFYYCTSLTSITIPNSVTSIGDCAFSSCDSLTSITIPNSVTSIGNYAFYYCTKLTSITLPNSVTSIGDSAFFSCTKLTSITIPKSVTTIGNNAFSWCESLTSITIPNSVTSIGDCAFCNCESLTSITLPDSVTSIGYRAFSYCRSLTSITVDPDNPVYHSNGNCLIETATNTLVVGCQTSVIPSYITSIGDSAFFSCDLLTSITIPDSVTFIGRYAFSACDSLISITVDPDNPVYHSNGNCLIKTATDSLVFGCQTSVIPSYVTSIGEGAFWQCTSLTSITIPNSVTSIGDSAFCECTSLTSITILNSVTSIGDSAFLWCTSLTGITLPNSVTSIGDKAFYSCDSLTSITIPNSVTSIGGGAFSSCDSLASITLPNSVTSIGDEAFYGCTKLTSIALPDSVTSIGNDAFYNCTSLTDVWYFGESREDIRIGSENGNLINATWHYVSTCPREHLYSGECDDTCNVCGNTRTIPDHIYDNAYDTVCNECNITRLQPPVIFSFTDSSVSLIAADGCEYSMDGETWQTDPTFTGLSPATTYAFYQRSAGTDRSAATYITTDKAEQAAVPAAPTVQSVTATTITLNAVNGCEYSMDGKRWQESPTFTDLNPATSYTFYERYAETATHYAGAASAKATFTTDKAMLLPPAAPTLSYKSSNTIVLEAHAGYEYSIGGVEWQTSPVFTGLSPKTNYMVYQRLAETGDHYATAASSALIVKTEGSPLLDGILGADDVQLVWYSVVKLSLPLSAEEIAAADQNGDGIVNLYDVARLFYMVNDLL